MHISSRMRLVASGTVASLIVTAPSAQVWAKSGQTSSKALNALPTTPVPSLIEVVLGLGIVLCLAYFLIRFLGRRTQIRQRGGIDLIAARQVAQNRSVQVIAYNGHRYLIGVGEQVTLLADLTLDDTDDELDASLGDATDVEGNGSFGLQLSKALQTARARYQSQNTKGEGR